MEFLGAVGGVVNVVDDLFESSSSDESLMSDECDDNDTTEHLALLLLYREEHEKQRNYRYMDVIKNYSALDHWRHFRVSRSTAKDTIDFVQPFDTVYLQFSS